MFTLGFVYCYAHQTTDLMTCFGKGNFLEHTRVMVDRCSGGNNIGKQERQVSVFQEASSGLSGNFT